MIFFLVVCSFEQIHSSDCPADSDLPECTSIMAPGSLCEADQRLPDGNSNYEVDNCDSYDVFRCVQGTEPINEIGNSYQLSFYILLINTNHEI